MEERRSEAFEGEKFASRAALEMSGLPLIHNF